jgi:hypothetical protein
MERGTLQFLVAHAVKSATLSCFEVSDLFARQNIDFQLPN